MENEFEDVGDPTKVQNMIRDTWMQDLPGRSLGMTDLLYTSRLQVYVDKLAETHDTVPLGKFK
eukprot:2810064-Pyramimonas_sp.AAC.1